MTCKGCFYPFPEAQCSNSNFQQPLGPQPCRPHMPALRKSFVTPPERTPVIAEFTDTQSLYVGQGLLISGVYYTVTDILDSLRVELQHNGVGATPGLQVVAVDPVYGCYTAPINSIGMVMLYQVPTVLGLNADQDASAGTVSDITKRLLGYGYVGPTTIEFTAEINADIAGTPEWVGISLPVPASHIIEPSFSAWIDEGSGPVPAVGKLGVGDYANYAVVGKGSSAFTDGGDRRISVSGRFEVLV